MAGSAIWQDDDPVEIGRFPAPVGIAEQHGLDLRLPSLEHIRAGARRRLVQERFGRVDRGRVFGVSPAVLFDQLRVRDVERIVVGQVRQERGIDLVQRDRDRVGVHGFDRGDAVRQERRIALDILQT